MHEQFKHVMHGKSNKLKHRHKHKHTTLSIHQPYSSREVEEALFLGWGLVDPLTEGCDSRNKHAHQYVVGTLWEVASV